MAELFITGGTGTFGKECIKSLLSDTIFYGTDKFPFSETSDVSPIGIYAQSKMKGEKLVMLNSAESIICRTNFLVGIEGVKGLYTSFTIT